MTSLLAILFLNSSFWVFSGHLTSQQNKQIKVLWMLLQYNIALKKISVFQVRKGSESVLKYFLRLNKTADLHPSSQIFVNRHLTLCYTVELYRKFWAISGHQNGWNIWQKQAEASILQNCQSFITFLCIKVLSHYCSLGTKKLLTGKLTLSIGKKAFFSSRWWCHTM